MGLVNGPKWKREFWFCVCANESPWAEALIACFFSADVDVPLGLESPCNIACVGEKGMNVSR